MSPVFVNQVRPGQVVYLGEIEGEFTLPDPLPERSLWISAGSGITPIMSMLRELDRRDALNDAILIHSARSKEDVIFGGMLRRMAERRAGLQTHRGAHRQRAAFHAGRPGRALPRLARTRDVRLRARASSSTSSRSATSRRTAPSGCTPSASSRSSATAAASGEGGSVYFRVSDCKAECDTGVSILVGGEEAGAKLPFGCRMGICHTCVGRLQDGAVRDLRTGAIEQASGQMVRVCINAPEGHVEIDL